jgi:hypothetical protein
MALFKTFSLLAASFSLVSSVATPIQELTFLSRRDGPMKMPKLPAWHFVNETTPDATPDGTVGVILEPDLIVGSTGKDGGKVNKVRLGPYSLRAGATIKGTVPAFQLPCKDCYVTAIQLGCEYPNGTNANVNSGAWWVLVSALSHSQSFGLTQRIGAIILI